MASRWNTCRGRSACSRRRRPWRRGSSSCPRSRGWVWRSTRRPSSATRSPDLAADASVAPGPRRHVAGIPHASFRGPVIAGMRHTSRTVPLTLIALVGALGLACQPATSARPPAPAATPSATASEEAAGDGYISWLVERSMLHQAELTARRYSGQGRLWQRPYASPQPRAASALAAVWFTAYPP